ncbi:MAG: hypothetical protein SGBAC_012770 [Bacillariaceae sp.]
MTMAAIDHRNHVNMNPNSPDRKLPVQPMLMVTPDRTVSTTDSLSDSHVDLSQEIDGMITVVKDYVQASKGYSPTRKEYERTMEVIEAKVEEEEALARKQEAEAARLQAEKAAQEAGFMDSLFSTFAFSGGESVATHQTSVASQRGTVVHEMLKRLVVQELLSRRNKSATVIQTTVRRVLAQKKKQEMRVIAAERKRALDALASQQKYDQYSRKAAHDEGDCCLEEEDEVAGEIKTSKYSKMKSALKSMKKKKKTKKSASRALLLPNSAPESSPRGQEGHDGDMPIQENKSRGQSMWKKVKKMKVKNLVSQKLNKRKKKIKKQKPQRYPSRRAPVLDGVVEEEEPVPEPEPRRMSITITTTDDSIPTPEAEAEAEAYRKRHEVQEESSEVYDGDSNFGSTLDSSLPSSSRGFRGNNRWSNVLADDATSVTSGRSRPLLDSWFQDFMFDKETLREVDDDAVEELVEMALTSNEVQRDLALIPEMDWTDEEWAEAKTSLFECSQDHYEEITYQTRRFVSNEVTL